MNNSTKEVTYTETYGELPTPTRTNYKFLGWYTDENNGEKIEDTTTVTITENQTLYAHWEKHILLSTMKQGDYVAYVGNNGCQNNGVDTTGTGEAESKNSCLGWNANQADTDTNSFGYCSNSNYKFSVTGWRIAYIENKHAYLVSAGSPECNGTQPSDPNLETVNQKAKKYCNRDYVDGDCSDNSDSWMLGNNDYNKITAQLTNTTGGYIYPTIENTTACLGNKSPECGYGYDLIDNGGYYWLAVGFRYGAYWNNSHSVVMNNTNNAHGYRPIIRLSSSVYATGGTGTMGNPYIIKNE